MKRVPITMLLTAVAGATIALPALAVPPARVFNGGDDDVGITVKPLITPEPPYDPDDLPVSEETIETNQELYDIREIIAQDAVWNGPGPNDLNLIVAGENPDWLAELRAEARVLARALRERGDSKAKADARELAKAWLGSATVEVPRGGAEPIGGGHDNRAHFVLNRWEVVDTGQGLIGEVPYTFSDFMIESWTQRFVTDDPDELNAVAGIANSLAVMLILEQELPIRFVGFNPNIHEPTGVLVVDSVGDGIPVPGANNAVNRIGRAPTAVEDVEPTTMTHNSWQNFPSMVRSLGFVLGMDWEQRHPQRDDYIDVQLQNLPPAGFPSPVAPASGIEGPGIPGTPAGTGPLFYDQSAFTTVVFEAPGCEPFDLDSMMLLGPFDYSVLDLPAYIIRDEYRYVDLNGDGVVNQTPGGPDDRMFNQPVPIFFSDCDLASLAETYTTPAPWYYGDSEGCFYDINRDDIQDGRDAALFLNLWLSQDPSADLVEPFGQVNQDDLDAFNGTPAQGGIIPFSVQVCTTDPLPPDAPWFYGKNPICPHDVNEDNVQNGADAGLFLDFIATGDPRGDIVPPFGVVNQNDEDAFFEGAPGIEPFEEGECDGDVAVVGWYYGKDPNCPHDVNEDRIQDANDVRAFIELYEAGDFSADLVPQFGTINILDLQAFMFGEAPFTEAFTPGFCAGVEPPGPDNRPGRINPD